MAVAIIVPCMAICHIIHYIVLCIHIIILNYVYTILYNMECICYIYYIYMIVPFLLCGVVCMSISLLIIYSISHCDRGGVLYISV